MAEKTQKASGWAAWNSKKSSASTPPKLDKATVKKSRAPGILDKAWGKVTKEVKKGKSLLDMQFTKPDGSRNPNWEPDQGKMFIYAPMNTLVKMSPGGVLKEVNLDGSKKKHGVEWAVAPHSQTAADFHEVTPSQAKRIKTLEKRYNAASDTAYKKYGVI